MRFSIAEEADIPQIIEINNSHFGSDDPSGFLIVFLTHDDVRNLIVSGKMTFYLAKNPEGLLLGYAEVGNSMDLKLLDDMTWESEETKELTMSILSNKYVYVKQLAVRKGFQRQGVAKFVYHNMEQIVGVPVVVFAANKPKHNDPSIRLHDSTGYQMVSKLFRAEFGEFTNYESFFYIKQFKG